MQTLTAVPHTPDLETCHMLAAFTDSHLQQALQKSAKEEQTGQTKAQSLNKATNPQSMREGTQQNHGIHTL